MPSSSVLFELQERPEMTCFLVPIVNLSVLLENRKVDAA